jgi:hypothetical protein
MTFQTNLNYTFLNCSDREYLAFLYMILFSQGHTVRMEETQNFNPKKYDDFYSRTHRCLGIIY